MEIRAREHANSARETEHRAHGKEIGAPKLQIEHAGWKLEHANMQIVHAPVSSRACECSDDPNGPPYLWATVLMGHRSITSLFILDHQKSDRSHDARP